MLADGNHVDAALGGDCLDQRAPARAIVDCRRDIGYARLIVLNLEAGMTPADLADEVTGEWIEPAPSTRRAEFARDQAPAAEPGSASVLVLDRLWIEPDWRGNRLGPIVAACAILRLGRGCRLAACYPAPFESPQQGADRERSVEALGRIWAKVGFTPWNDGVWMLDLQSDAARESLERLLPRAATTTKDDDETALSR